MMIVALLRAILDELADLIAHPPAPHEEEERARQLGMSIIRKAADERARREIGGL
jgi:hypothetical protein